MNVRSFLDTNVLIYTDDQRYPEKHQRACELVKEARSSGLGVISLQVLKEYFAAATRKLGVPLAVAKGKVEIFARLQVVTFEPGDILESIDLQESYQLSFWDAMILHAARKADCRILLSEDLNPGARLAGVEIQNPFA